MAGLIEIEIAANLILAGEVICLPTDTVYALSADATNGDASNKIYAIKGRSPEQALPIFIASLEQGLEIAEFSPKALALARKFWPGTLTLVLPLKASQNIITKVVYGDRNSIALRMPDNDIVLDVIDMCKRPLVATSANISGRAAVNRYNDLSVEIITASAIVVRDKDSQGSGVASTIVDLSNDKVEIVRLGEITEEEILDCVRDYD